MMMTSYRPIVFAAARNRGRSTIKVDDTFVTQILDMYLNIGMRIAVFGVSADKGIGEVVKKYCLERQIPFSELTFFFHIEPELRERELYNHAYVARNSALVEIGTDFYVFVSNNRKGVMEDLITKIKANPEKNYTIYNEQNQIIESHDSVPNAQTAPEYEVVIENEGSPKEA